MLRTFQTLYFITFKRCLLSMPLHHFRGICLDCFHGVQTLELIFEYIQRLNRRVNSQTQSFFHNKDRRVALECLTQFRLTVQMKKESAYVNVCKKAATRMYLQLKHTYVRHTQKLSNPGKTSVSYDCLPFLDTKSETCNSRACRIWLLCIVMLL